MPTLALINFNIVCATLGGFVSLFGLVSYLCKEQFYLSEARKSGQYSPFKPNSPVHSIDVNLVISLLAGVAFSPHAANFIRPADYALHSQENLDAITLHFTRLVLGVQLVLAGVQLPKRYLQIEWRSLSLLLGPGMIAMWLCSSLVIWAMIPNFEFLHALIVAACVTPTDPVLSNSIVKGKFADKHVPRPLQRIIVAESGANDGLGYPFLFFGIYLLKYLGMNGAGYTGGGGKAMGLWFYETWVYTILLSVVYGTVTGWLARKLLHWAEEKHYVDRESFLVFAIALAVSFEISRWLVMLSC
jgi:NhaP-type Na+/H+ or K+/H+ antiporter